VALAAADEVAERHTRTHRAAELAVQRARYDADRAERSDSNPCRPPHRRRDEPVRQVRSGLT
jgi:hypothetical protein